MNLENEFSRTESFQFYLSGSLSLRRGLGYSIFSAKAADYYTAAPAIQSRISADLHVISRFFELNLF